MEFESLIIRGESSASLSAEKIEKVMGDLDVLVNDKKASISKVLKINHFPYGEKGVEHALLGYIDGIAELFLQTEKWGKKGVAYLTKNLEYKVVAPLEYKGINFTSNECIEVVDRDKNHFIYYKQGENYTHDNLVAVEVVNIPPTEVIVAEEESHTASMAFMYFNGDTYFLGLVADAEGTILTGLSGENLKNFAKRCVGLADGKEDKYPKLEIMKSLEV